MSMLAAGALVVARPELTDPNFMRSVIYLLEHHGGGTMGLIINRPLTMTLGTLWDDCPSTLRDLPCCASGGPVELHKGLLLHGFHGIPQAYAVGEDIFIGGQPEHLREHLSQHASADHRGPRLFLGHAGWGKGQLEEEIRAGSWLVRAGHPRLLLDNEPDADLWQTMIQSHGEHLRQPSLN